MSMALGKHLALMDFSSPRSTSGGEPLYFEDAGDGRTFLDIFLERVFRIDFVDSFVAVVHPRLQPRLQPVLHRFPIIKVVGVPGDIDPFLSNYEWVGKSRAWSYQGVKGGAFDMSWYDEVFPIRVLMLLAQQASPETMVHLHPEMPLFVPEYASQSLAVELEGNPDGVPMPMLVRQAPLGSSPALITRKGVQLFRQNVAWTPAGVLRFFQDVDGLVKMEVYIGNNADSDLIRLPVLLRTRRDLAFLRRILPRLPDRETSGLADALARLKADEPELFLEPLPKEADVEISAAPWPVACRLPALPAMADMDPALLERIRDEVSSWGDGLLTIGDLGDVLAHRDLEAIRRVLAAKKPHGLHVVWNAETLMAMDQLPLSWLDMEMDVLTVRLTPLSYSARFKLDDFEPLLGKLSARMQASPKAPVIHLEIHKHEENWRDFQKVHDWQTKYMVSTNWAPYNTYAGQMPAIELPEYFPRKRYPCEKALHQLYVLPDGTVPLCKQDFRATTRLGDAGRDGLAGVWNGEAHKALRLRHMRLDLGASPLCPRCTRWFHA